jgi:pilus assembly protein Flp/PilA
MIRTPEGQKTMFKCPTLKTAAPVLRFLRDESGATAIEYAMIASGIGVAIATTVVSLGSTVKGLFTSVSTSLK